MTKTPAKYWVGPAPRNCDICGATIGAGGVKFFIDGRAGGPWANMCPTCHAMHGDGLGTGRGQKYQLQRDGRWKKVEG